MDAAVRYVRDVLGVQDIGAGAQLIGWIGNCVDPQMLRSEDNLATLRTLLPAPCPTSTESSPA